MKARLLCAALTVLALGGCATSTKIPPDELRLRVATQAVVGTDNPPSYQSVWDLYLKSSQIEATGPKYQVFEQFSALVAAGKLQCTEVDWAGITNSNFWSLKPHIAAAACYEQHGLTLQAQPHNRAIDFLLTGILSSGNGEAYYSAYEVASIGDAHDVVELMGYDIVDFYGDFNAGRKAFYYVVVANDPKTKKQHEIYFNNQRFVHAVMGVQYPFLGLTDSWNDHVLPKIAGLGRAMRVPMAAAEAADGNLDRAYQLYMEAIADGSLRARYRLALLAITKKLPQITPQQGVQLLMEAAEKQYVPAIVILSYLYEIGAVVERDSALAKQLIDSVGDRKEPGYAYNQLAAHIGDGLLTSPDELAANSYLRLASSAGNVDARLTLLLQRLETQNAKVTAKENTALSESTETSEKLATLAELKTIAEDGSKWASYLVADWQLENFSKGSAEFGEAEEWLKKAAKFGIPAAYHRLGLAYQNGDFGEPNKRKALNYFVEGALRFYPASMLSVGYYNDQGIVVHADKVFAARWYSMCSALGNIICSANLGYFFQHGIGVRQDFNVALQLFEAAAAGKYSQGFIGLGNLYLDGNGVAKDVNKAIENFQKAADLGNYYGDYRLGVLYLQGREIPMDLAKAKEHFLKAKKHPYTEQRLAEIDAQSTKPVQR